MASPFFLGAYEKLITLRIIFSLLELISTSIHFLMIEELCLVLLVLFGVHTGHVIEKFGENVIIILRHYLL